MFSRIPGKAAATMMALAALAYLANIGYGVRYEIFQDNTVLVGNLDELLAAAALFVSSSYLKE